MVGRAIAVLEQEFIHEIKLTIVQTALVCNNIEYLKFSLEFLKDACYRECRNQMAHDFYFSSQSLFTQLVHRCEDKLLNEIRAKVDDFVTIVEE